MKKVEPKNDNYNYGQIIKDIRIESGLTQNDVAKALDVTPGYICNIENGRTSMSLRMLIYFSKLTNRSLDSLIGQLEPEHTESAVDRELKDELLKFSLSEKKKILEMLKIWNK